MASSSRSGRDNNPGRDQRQPKPPQASNKGKGRGKPPDLPDQEGDKEDQPRPTKGGYESKHAQKRAREEGSDSWDSEDSIYQDMAGIARPHADAVRHAYDIPNMFGSDAEETHLGTEDSEAGMPPSTFGEGPESPLPHAAEPQASTRHTARPRRPPPSLARDDTSSSASSRSSKRHREPSPPQRRQRAFQYPGNPRVTSRGGPSHWQDTYRREPVPEPPVPDLS